MQLSANTSEQVLSKRKLSELWWGCKPLHKLKISCVTIGVWNSYPFALVKKKKKCLVYLVCYFQPCEQQEKSNLVPILGALPDGHLLLPSVWETMGSWQHYPVQNWHTNKRTMWQRYRTWHMLNSFLPWWGIKLSLLTGERAEGHCPLPMSPGLCSLPTGQWAHSLISASLDSTGRSTGLRGTAEFLGQIQGSTSLSFLRGNWFHMGKNSSGFKNPTCSQGLLPNSGQFLFVLLP